MSLHFWPSDNAYPPLIRKWVLWFFHSDLLTDNTCPWFLRRYDACWLCCILVVLNMHSSLQLVSGSYTLLSFADKTHPWLFRLSVAAMPHCVLSLLMISFLLFSWSVVATMSCWLAENCFCLSRKYAVHCSVLCLLMMPLLGAPVCELLLCCIWNT